MNFLMKKNLISALLIVLSYLISAAAGTIDLEQEYRKLDQAIEQTDRYVQDRENRIRAYKTARGNIDNDRAQYELSRSLYEEYRSYVSDSAIHYIGRCITLAEKMGDRIRAEECRLLLAYQCIESGMYHEASDILNSINENSINDANNQRRYYITMAHLYQELGYYCRVPQLQGEYYAKHDHYKNLINNDKLSTNDDEALQIKELEHFSAGDAPGALQYSDQRLKQVQKGTHQYAIVAFYRYLDYSLAGDSVQARYWVTQSALGDVENAVMDQGAMWELANLLMGDGDINRAYRYIHFAWQCANKFNTRKRNNQISPVLTAISDNYEASLKRANRWLAVLAGVLSLLAVLVLGSLFYSNSQRKKLARARNELSESNVQLAQLNAQLSDLNSQMRETNVKLNESNRVKDEYVGRFIHLCSFYIDRLDEMRKRVNKMVKSKDLNALYKFTEGNDLRDNNLKELYEMFDSTFLHLFPNFVDDFNALLKPECRITLPDQEALNTDIRIFALIRLGIEDSSRIAEFLHYSVNTIYNYRAKIKNGALDDRDTFESHVKAIGMYSPPDNDVTQQ